MSKKRNENSFWNNGPDSELIARFTGFLKQVLLNERSTYLKNLKKKELMPPSRKSVVHAKPDKMTIRPHVNANTLRLLPSV